MRELVLLLQKQSGGEEKEVKRVEGEEDQEVKRGSR